MNKAALSITSEKFSPGDRFPLKYTCFGLNVNPPLEIENLPETTESLVVILEDVTVADKPSVLWVQYNIPGKNWINEDERKGELGLNGLNQCSYIGPCSESGSHRYVFKIYALNDFLFFDHSGVNKHEIEEGIIYHLIGYGQIEAVYEVLPFREQWICPVVFSLL